jgi:hypothetical protein
MNFVALHDAVKFIIATHLASDLKIRSMLSKNHDIQQILFGDVVYNDDLNAKDNENFKNEKIFKIYISHIQVMSYILVALVIL